MFEQYTVKKGYSYQRTVVTCLYLSSSDGLTADISPHHQWPPLVIYCAWLVSFVNCFFIMSLVVHSLTSPMSHRLSLYLVIVQGDVVFWCLPCLCMCPIGRLQQCCMYLIVCDISAEQYDNNLVKLWYLFWHHPIFLTTANIVNSIFYS